MRVLNRKRRKRRRRKQRRSRQSLRFTPYAWAKLVYLRDAGDTEVGLFGLSQPDDLLLIEDVTLIRQRCTPVTVEMDDTAVADYFDSQVDAGRQPEQFLRHWLHTHPGGSALPSGTDETTFKRVFGSADWATMFILAREGATYCRLGFHVGPKTSKPLRVEIDYQRPFPATDYEAWQAEYDAAVEAVTPKWAGLWPGELSLEDDWEAR